MRVRNYFLFDELVLLAMIMKRPSRSVVYDKLKPLDEESAAIKELKASTAEKIGLLTDEEINELFEQLPSLEA